MATLPRNIVTTADSSSDFPTLVFLHYFSGSAASWHWVIEQLQPNFRCIALDLPGFGDAQPLAEPGLAEYSSFIRNAIADLKISDYVLVGHSMGGKMAVQVAIDETAERLKQVILVAPSPPTQEPMPQEERDRMLSDHHNPEVAAKTVDSASQQTLPEPRRELAIKTHTIAEDQTWRWWLLDGMNNSIASHLDQVQVPVTVIASPNDPVIPWETIQQEVLALLPQAELVELSDSGHLMPLELPEQLAQSIRQAVESQIGR